MLGAAKSSEPGAGRLELGAGSSEQADWRSQVDRAWRSRALAGLSGGLARAYLVALIEGTLMDLAINVLIRRVLRESCKYRFAMD